MELVNEIKKFQWNWIESSQKEKKRKESFIIKKKRDMFFDFFPTVFYFIFFLRQIKTSGSVDTNLPWDINLKGTCL